MSLFLVSLLLVLGFCSAFLIFEMGPVGQLRSTKGHIEELLSLAQANPLDSEPPVHPFAVSKSCWSFLQEHVRAYDSYRIEVHRGSTPLQDTPWGWTEAWTTAQLYFPDRKTAMVHLYKGQITKCELYP